MIFKFKLKQAYISCTHVNLSRALVSVKQNMLHIYNTEFAIQSRDSYYYELFVFKYLFAWIFLNKATVWRIFYFEARVFYKINVWYFSLHVSEMCLELLIKVISFLKTWLKGITPQNTKLERCFSQTTLSGNWHKYSPRTQNVFVHNFKPSKVYQKVHREAKNTSFEQKILPQTRVLLCLNHTANEVSSFWSNQRPICWYQHQPHFFDSIEMFA